MSNYTRQCKCLAYYDGASKLEACPNCVEKENKRLRAALKAVEEAFGTFRTEVRSRVLASSNPCTSDKEILDGIEGVRAALKEAERKYSDLVITGWRPIGLLKEISDAFEREGVGVVGKYVTELLDARAALQSAEVEKTSYRDAMLEARGALAESQARCARMEKAGNAMWNVLFAKHPCEELSAWNAVVNEPSGPSPLVAELPPQKHLDPLVADVIYRNMGKLYEGTPVPDPKLEAVREAVGILAAQPDLVRTDTGERGDGELNEILSKLRAAFGLGGER